MSRTLASYRSPVNLTTIGRLLRPVLAGNATIFPSKVATLGSDPRISSQHLYCSSSMDTAFRPRRAVMYVPASDERKTNKAASLAVDTLTFDLEDGVAVNQKVQKPYKLLAGGKGWLTCSEHGILEIEHTHTL